MHRLLKHTGIFFEPTGCRIISLIKYQKTRFIIYEFQFYYHRAWRACVERLEMRLVDGGWACEVNETIWIVVALLNDVIFIKDFMHGDILVFVLMFNGNKKNQYKMESSNCVVKSIARLSQCIWTATELIKN